MDFKPTKLPETTDTRRGGESGFESVYCITNVKELPEWEDLGTNEHDDYAGNTQALVDCIVRNRKTFSGAVATAMIEATGFRVAMITEAMEAYLEPEVSTYFAVMYSDTKDRKTMVLLRRVFCPFMFNEHGEELVGDWNTEKGAVGIPTCLEILFYAVPNVTVLAGYECSPEESKKVTEKVKAYLGTLS